MVLLLGQIVILPFNFTPQHLALCDGSLLLIAENAPLFSLIGTTFGGAGRTNFALPNYQGQAPKGSQYYIAIDGEFPAR